MDQPAAAPAVLVVVGMHRSGTSLTASLLQSAGVHLGERLMGAGLGNVRGHFENLEFHGFHQAVLRSQSADPDGWTLQERIAVEDWYRDEAQRLIQKNAAPPVWGWKDPRTTLLLEFWAEMLPQANFVMVYRAPWEVVDSLYRRASDPMVLQQPDLAAKFWLHYNRKILQFERQFSDRCLLASISTVVQHPAAWIADINQKFQLQLTPPKTEVYEAELLRAQSSKGYEASLIHHYFPEAIAIYAELQQRTWLPAGVTLDAISPPNSPYRLWVFQQWLHQRQQEQHCHTQQAEVQQCQAQLQQAQTALQKAQSQLQQVQAELVATKAELERSRPAQDKVSVDEGLHREKAELA
jgi:hypothetical protein